VPDLPDVPGAPRPATPPGVPREGEHSAGSKPSVLFQSSTGRGTRRRQEIEEMPRGPTRKFRWWAAAFGAVLRSITGTTCSICAPWLAIAAVAGTVAQQRQERCHFIRAESRRAFVVRLDGATASLGTRIATLQGDALSTHRRSPLPTARAIQS